MHYSMNHISAKPTHVSRYTKKIITTEVKGGKQCSGKKENELLSMFRMKYPNIFSIFINIKFEFTICPKFDLI